MTTELVQIIESPTQTTLDTPFAPTQRPNIIPGDDDSCGDPVVHNTVSKSIHFNLTSNPFGASIDITTTTKGNHPTLGLDLLQHPDNDRILLK